MSFEVMVDKHADSAIVGIGPFDPGTDAAVEPDYGVVAIADDAQLERCLDLFPNCKLSADGTTVEPIS